MNFRKWVLKVELNGEWEECYYSTCTEAMAAFLALASDYAPVLQNATLFLEEPSRFKDSVSQYVN